MLALFHFATMTALVLPNGNVSLRNPTSNRCIDAQSFGTANGTPLISWDCTGANNQAFVLKPVAQSGGTQYYNLFNVHAKKCVDVSRMSTHPGAPLHLWECLGAGQYNQQWEIVDPLLTGQYRLRARHSGQVLDLAGGNTGPGTRLQQWPDNGAWPQRWFLMAAPKPTGSPFLHVTQSNWGPGLGVGNQTIYLKGLQLWYSLSPCGFSRDRMLAALDETKRAGANTVRLWFFQSGGGPNRWALFDDTIAQVKARGLYAIITLVNQWGDCEPAPGGTKHYLTREWYESGYKRAGDGYRLPYRDYVYHVAAHFKDETAIAMYQLVNEAEARNPLNGTCPDDNASARAIRGFADDMVDVIHSVDKNHLINLGTQDNGFCGVQGDNFAFVHAGKVDLCEVHSYDAANVALPPLSADKVKRCNQLRKPTFMGEVGICQNVQADGRCRGNVTAQTLQNRANFFTQKARANRAAGLSGFLLWDWQYYDGDTFGINLGEPVLSQMPQW